jgi:hypothetical protein
LTAIRRCSITTILRRRGATRQDLGRPAQRDGPGISRAVRAAVRSSRRPVASASSGRRRSPSSAASETSVARPPRTGRSCSRGRRAGCLSAAGRNSAAGDVGRLADHRP